MSMKVFPCCTRNLSDDNGADGVGNGSSVDNGADGVDNRVGHSVGNGDSLGVDSLAVVGDSGDVSLDVVGSVGDVLGATVREGNGVRSSPGGGAVVSLGGLEVGAGVVVGNSVLVRVGGDLVGVHLGNGVGNSVDRGVVSGSSVDNRGSVDSVDSVGNRVGNAVSDNSVGKSVANNSVGKSVSDNRGSMDNRGGMDYWSNGMSNTVAHYSVAYKTVVANTTMPNHSSSSEDLGGRRSGSCKGGQSNEDL